MKKRILVFLMSAVLTAAFMVSPCTHAFNIDRECGEVVVTIIDEETNELFKEPGKFGMTMVDDKWDASESNPYTIKNVPKNDAYCITYDPVNTNDDDYCYAIDSEKSIPLFYLNADEDAKDITIYMHKRPIENKAEYGTIIVTVIDEETNELFKEDGVNDDVNFWIMGSSAEGQSSFGFGGSSHNQFNSNISNPYTLNNALVNESYKIIHLGYNHDGFTYMIDEEKSDDAFVYSTTEPKEVKIYMKKDIWADHKSDTDASEKPDIQADKEYTFEDIRSMTTEEIQELFELKGVKNNRVHTSDNTQNNFLLDPMPYLKDNLPEDIYGSNEIIYRFDEEKVKRSLGLPDELFEITVEASMPIGLDDTPVQKYCECIIQPKTEDIQTRKELIAAAMNYVKLNPDYRDVGVFFELGGWNNNVMSTTTVSTSTTTTVTTTTAKQTSFEEPVSDSKTTTAIVKTLEGDVNCDDEVDMADAVLIMQALANPNKYGIDGTAEHHLTEQGKTNGDMNGDGLTVGDAQAIQKKLLGLDAPSELTLDKTVDWYHSNTAESFWDICFDGEYSAVITNTEELEVYLSKVLQDKAIKAYVEKYNDSFFKDNVLLLDSIYQSAGMKAGYQIDNVDFSDDEISVSVVYAFSKGQALECVVSLCIAQVIVPKEAYNGQTVNWTIEKPYV
ncbi:dockerin type I repeat-containing protein [Ruminococcus sp.]|uniref:dockerin type I repeat-containing protein n=1 Tax=Ruminococcus sp. TaxID=41978 RepID=UPI0025CE8832|nr:dockerin type I repeat-containing protein [Ruminococcus sp.]